MFFIVVGHFLIYRQNGIALAKEGQAIGTSRFECLSIILMNIVIIGTNIFFLISGYFGIHFKIKRFIELVFITYFYGGVIELFLLWKGEISFNTFIFSLVTLIEKYWFIEVYLLLMLMSVVLNIFIVHITEKLMNSVIIVGFIVLCIYGYIHDCSRIGVSQGFSIIWANYLYLVGAKIRTIKIKRIPVVIIYLCSTIIYIGISLCITFFGKWELYWSFSIAYNNPLVFISSVMMFLLFCSAKNSNNVKANKIIHFFSSTTIGVYLIHTAPNLNLFQRVDINYDMDSVGGASMFFIIVIGGSGLVYIICSLIDFLRQRKISKVFNRCINNIINKFSEPKETEV